MSSIPLRTPEYSWAWASASGELRGLDWVSDHLDAESPGFQEHVEEDTTRFEGPSLAATMPPPMVQAAIEAAQRGEPTAIAGLAMVLARAGWLVESRKLLWTSHTPLPELLAALVEAYGVEPEVHRGDAAVLVNLRARLPGWFPHRGKPQAAIELLEGALDEDVGVTLLPATPSNERFACHDAAWWAQRAPHGDHLVIRDGIVERASANAVAPRTEDVVLRANTHVGGTPRSLLRLLPIWATPRIAGAGEP